MTRVDSASERRWFTPVADPSKALKIAGTHLRDSDSFFAARPYKGVIEFEDGRAITWPFRAQSIVATMFWGTANEAAVNQTLEGTGMFPVSVQGADGVVKPLMQAWYVHYKDTSLATEDNPERQYIEFLALLIVTEKRIDPLPYVNCFSTTLGVGVPGALFFELPLLLNHELATMAGRYLVGMDKQFAREIDETNTKTGTANQLEVQILESPDKPLIHLSATVDPAKAAAEIKNIMSAYGFTDPSQLAKLPKKSTVEMVNKDVRGGSSLVRWSMSTSTEYGPIVMHSSASTDIIRVRGSSHLGDCLLQLQFSPEVVGATQDMMGSYEVHGLAALAAKPASH